MRPQPISMSQTQMDMLHDAVVLVAPTGRARFLWIIEDKLLPCSRPLTNDALQEAIRHALDRINAEAQRCRP